MVDAAYHIPGRKSVYIWSGRQYARIDFEPGGTEEHLVSGPRSIASGWTTMAEKGVGRVDAVVPVPGHKDQLYVFFGGKYLKIKLDDKLHDSFVNKDALPISHGWKALAKAGFDTVDAAMLVPGTTTQMYFFRGLNYLRWDNDKDEILNGPSPIKDGWPALAASGFDVVDAVFAHPEYDDVFYFFHGDKYARIKVDRSSRHDSIYSAAKPISAGWKTLDGWV
ncbi:hypothetical protein ABOM_005759 [Aspergillus bombycis]|uniref:Hemopexin n=1 Tax=Aspergillus bombycis TaxID=109264 RepID=A0A1F8A132_9EURO|nr:hypothetical protein ABOM_005759 [Aspergillus bombycis]OGM45018.1 hypothetical protein ABOM_005759 [Aspergillus bombycis]